MKKEVTVKVKTVGTPIAESIKCRLISDTMINLTRSKAFEILEYDTFSAERQVREHVVQHLYNEWLAGRFMWHQAMVAHGYIMERTKDGSMAPHIYRLNGQHTCWMRVNIPKEKEPQVTKVRQLIYECQDMDGLREIYSVIDRNTPRTNAHITNVLLADTSSSIGFPLSYMNRLIGGLRLWMWEGQWDRKFKGSPQEMAAIIQGKHADLFRIVSTFFQLKYSEWGPIRRAGTVAALFETFNKAGGLAPDFWEQVCSGLGFTSKEDPRYQLRLFCDEHGHSACNPSKEVITAEDLYRISINMWNKWRKGEKVSAVRNTDSRMKAI